MGIAVRPMSAPFLTPATVATRLGLSRRKVAYMLEAGEIPSYKFGSSRRIDPADLENFLSEARTVPPDRLVSRNLDAKPRKGAAR
jgi:excisionase family DNA binding protein